MTVRPTPLSAALAGAFSALTWPFVWPYFKDTSGSSTLWLMLGSIVLIALPAHAFVLGFRGAGGAARSVDSALLVRIGAWVACGAVTALLAARMGVISWA